MPIRFACPSCKQKLSVSSRKAGSKADCPRCHETITIPKPRPAAVAAAAKEAVSAGPVADEAPPAELPADGPPLAEDDQEPYPTFEDTVVVYDTGEEAPPPTSWQFGDQQDLVTVPRYVLYLQGGLLALVALVSFTIGILAGGAFSGGPAGPHQPQACIISGTINYAAGGRNVPDMGAVVAVVPQHLKPDEKAPIGGLRPEDPTPDETHRGIAILRELGGAYARADDKGHYEIRVPDRGRYLVLVISHDRQIRSIDEIDTQDILKLGPFFENASDLLGKHRYKLSLASVRGDQQHNVLFE